MPNNNIEDASLEGFFNRIDAKREFEKLPKEEQDRILAECEIKRRKEETKRARLEGWRKWRGR